MLTKIGSLTEVYTQTEYALGTKCPRVGATWHDYSLGKSYIFLKNSGTTAITAGTAATSLGTDKAAFFCEISPTGTGRENHFAGVRALLAISLAQNEYGWFQVAGSASMIADATGTTANKGVVLSATTVGTVTIQVYAGTLAGFSECVAAFGNAQTTTTTGAVIVSLSKNVWGVGL